jgi:hypothetical protein
MYDDSLNRVPTIPAVCCDAPRRRAGFHQPDIGPESQTTRGFFQPSIETAAQIVP